MNRNAQTRNAGPGVAVVGDDNCTTTIVPDRDAAQLHRVLEYLRDVGPANTMFLRDRLNVMMPASRIKELRARGHEIHTTRIAIHDREISGCTCIAVADLFQFGEGAK